jgi:prepilin-type N-terminal cleavage/methylation domain-containing protein
MTGMFVINRDWLIVKRKQIMIYTSKNRDVTFHRTGHLAGFTLIELMVAMAVTVIGMSIMVQSMAIFGKTYSRYKEVVYTQTNNRIVLDIVGDQFNMAGYFLARPRQGMVDPEDAKLGVEPISDIDVDQTSGLTTLAINGNIFDNYGPVSGISGGSVYVPDAPDENFTAEEKLRSMSSWVDVDNYNVGSLVQIYSGKRSTELSSSSIVYRLDGVDVDGNSLSLGAAYGNESGFTSYGASEKDLYIVSEILPRKVESPLYQQLNSNHKLYLTTEPNSKRIPAVDFVVEVNYANLTEVLNYVTSEDPEATSINDIVVLMEVATRTPSEYFEHSSHASTEVDAHIEGIDLDGQPTNGLAIIRRATMPVVFESLITVNPSFWHQTARARLDQVRFACLEYGGCGF